LVEEVSLRPLSARIVSVEVIKTNLYFPFIGSYEKGERARKRVSTQQ